MSGLAVVLQQELRQLVAAARRRDVEVKEACERAAAKLKAAEGVADIAKDDDILHPFMLAIDTKQPKQILIASNGLQQLLSHNAISAGSLKHVVAALEDQLSSSDPVLLLKILQCMLALLTVAAPHGPLLMSSLDVCFRLQTSKLPAVQSTAEASLRQVVLQLFDRAAQERQEASVAAAAAARPSEARRSSAGSADASGGAAAPVSDAPAGPDDAAEVRAPASGGAPRVSGASGAAAAATAAAAAAAAAAATTGVSAADFDHPESAHGLGVLATDAFSVIQDIVLLINGDHARFLKMPAISPVVGLELLESVLCSYPNVFRNVAPFTLLMKERVCSMLIKAMNSKSPFPISVRVLAILSSLIRIYGDLLVTETEIFLSQLLKLADPDTQLSLRILILELLRQLVQSPSIVKSFFCNYDLQGNATKVCHDIGAFLLKFLRHTFVNDDGVVIHSQVGKMKLSESRHDVDAPSLPSSYSVGLAASAVIALINAVEALREADIEVTTKLAASLWTPLFEALAFLLQSANSENLLQDVLGGCQTLLHACGRLHLTDARSTILQMLCKLALPPRGPASHGGSIAAGSAVAVVVAGTPVSTGAGGGATSSGGSGGGGGGAGAAAAPDHQLSAKNLQIMKALVNISHCMGDVLEDSWRLVLETLQSLDAHILKYSDSVSQSDRDILATAIRELFSASSYLEDNSIRHVALALSQMSSIRVERGKAAPGRKPRLFAANKLVDVTMHNSARIMLLWGIVSEHLLALVAHSNADIRSFGVASLSQICVAGLHSIGQRRETLAKVAASETQSAGAQAQLEKSNAQVDQDEVSIVVGLCKLAEASVNETKADGLKAIYNLLQTAGHDLRHGWDVVLRHLLAVATSGEKVTVPIAFRSLQLICSDYFPLLTHDCLELCIRTIGKFCTQTMDVNISLTAVGLLWDAADHLRRNRDKIMGEVRDRSGEAAASEQYGNLWLDVFAHMETLAADMRSDVRNSSLRTLFASLNTHGGVLEEKTWQALIWQIIVPVVDIVRVGPGAAAGAGASAESGGDVAVHHSRNSAEKQFAETRVITWNGLSRVIATYMKELQRFARFDDLWIRVVRFADAYASIGQREVFLAVAVSMPGLIDSLVAASCTRAMWVVFLDVAVTLCALCSEHTEKCCQAALAVPVHLLGTHRSLMSDRDLLRMLLCFDVIVVSCEFAHLRLEALQNVFQLSDNSAAVELALLRVAVRYVGAGVSNQVEPVAASARAASAAAGSSLVVRALEAEASVSEGISESDFAQLSERVNLTASLLETSLALFVARFRAAPLAVQSSFAGHAVAAFRRCLVAQRGREALWNLAMRAYTDFLPDCISAMNTRDNASALALDWLAVYHSVEQAVDVSGLVSHYQTSVPLIVSFVENLRQRVLLRVPEALSNITESLIELVARHARLHPFGNLYVEELNVACLELLFAVLRTPDRTALLALGHVLKHCHHVLKEYVVDDAKHGAVPLPRHRHVEVQLLVGHLTSSETSLDLFPNKLHASHGFLVHFFPVLCQLIHVTNASVRSAVSGALQQFGHVVGL